ncbi:MULTISPECIES: class I SAM-dependent methyltransferase [Streptomyces]|uniref:Class I SAM-dependent methyltransferase n=2 Tax=Streptomyces TaxID=1883 RepID=A0A3R7EW83_9ACTN|nr:MULTISPECIES: class I SAM-dependent methyltransferase [Streptomyces]KNE82450.1 methyltransferase [Streptomyces fradiae]OFA49493.1 methyltransferase [Streptomyces fradiae]PQM22884.1 class I SAM-dependent methyltransferase [Streptomyces xinghaiensis]RKM97359.1 class I SAM-dependent methyltransferase [Streptomyces xinghaiensis]RNC73807.1 class I SAM-dependent methyltransferase [Streptomyces xinghaiensis]
MAFDHNDHYHRLVLRHVPGGCRTALDVGCGTGGFARRLADRGIAVDAVDPATEMIEAARARSERRGGRPGPRYRQADITRTELPGKHYDFISCLASIHHMPFGTVAELRDALAPGGALVILGCYRETSPVDRAWSLAAVPANAVARLAVRAAETIRAAGGSAAHGPEGVRSVRAPVRQPAMSLAAIRRETSELLPGATLRRLLFWRYLLVFRKSNSSR